MLKAAAGTVKGGCALTCTAQQCGMGYFYICYTLSPGSFALWHHTAAKTLGEVEEDLAVNMGLFHSGMRGACGPKQLGLTWQSGLAFARLVSLEAMLSVLSGPLTASFLCATTRAHVPGVALSARV